MDNEYNESLRGKRKKKKNPYPNPLFLHWIKEWRDDAKSKGLKTHHTYNKAYRSMQKYPLVLQTGKECKILEFVGDRICTMLDEKLSEYIQEHGTTEPIPGIIDLPSNFRAHKEPRRKKPTSIREVSEELLNPVNFTAEHSDSSQMTDKTKPKKEYMPAEGSGPYAIIVSLYHNHCDSTTPSFMTKQELMDAADQLSEHSFFTPQPGSRYTAWSSMGSLINKHLVMKEGNPAKYSLSGEGQRVARRVLERERGGQETLERPDLVPALKQQTIPSASVLLSNKQQSQTCKTRPRIKKNMSEISDIKTNLSTACSQSKMEVVDEKSCDEFQFCYVDDCEEETQLKNKAVILIDDEVELGFLVKCNYEQLLLSGKQYKLDNTRACETLVYAFLHNKDAPEKAPLPKSKDSRLIHKQVESAASQSSSLLKGDSKQSWVNDAEMLPLAERLKRKHSKISTAKNKITSSKAVCSATISSETKFTKFDYTKNVSSKPLEDRDDVQFSTDLPEPDFVLKAGSFDIVLCVDSREHYGGPCLSKQMLVPELQRHAVHYDIRPLQIGDFMWIAKPKGKSDKDQELVLDYIIERKRMDDLASSITDGRFREQKFRLKQCGARNVIYLIEDYGSNKNLSIAEDTLMQAIINSQIVDGFQIKRVKDTHGSIKYLAIMTRYLQAVYSNKNLTAFKKQTLDGSGIKSNFNDKDQYLLTYQEFSLSSVKTKALTVREMFGKLLVQIHGLTPEKALAILEHYPTPALLWEAYQAKGTIKEQESILTSITFGPTRRTIGPSLSRQIFQLYNTDKLT